jgi:hypothetical protein
MAEEVPYVVLEPFKPVRLVFDKFGRLSQKVTDPVLGWEKTVPTLKFHVIEKDGKPADTVYSVMSVKLKKEFEPYLANERFRRYAFTIVKDGGVDKPPRIVSVEPL